MNTKNELIVVGNYTIEVVKKEIKNMHLAVYPPNGRIRIAVPFNTSDESIRLFAISKLSWIKKQRLKFNNQERQTKREYSSGESHYFLGKRYLLKVIDVNPAPRVEIERKSHISLYIKPKSTSAHRQKLLEKWYRAELKRQLVDLENKWIRIIGIKPEEIIIRKMRTRWGTCNNKTKKITLNLELIKKPVQCLEYVFVHEMIHLIEKKHSDKFQSYMNKFLPKWKYLKQELNQSPLSFVDWIY